MLDSPSERTQSAVTRHRIQRMYAIQYEVSVDPSRPLRTVPADAVASMNTYDMPPFAAFARGSDIDDRATSGLLSGDGIERAWEAQRTIMTSLTGFLRKGHWLSWTEDEAGEGTGVGRRAMHGRCSVSWRVYVGSSP
jgi:4-alpha-glucanotransferase